LRLLDLRLQHLLARELEARDDRELVGLGAQLGAEGTERPGPAVRAIASARPSSSRLPELCTISVESTRPSWFTGRIITSSP